MGKQKSYRNYYGENKREHSNVYRECRITRGNKDKKKQKRENHE